MDNWYSSQGGQIDGWRNRNSQEIPLHAYGH